MMAILTCGSVVKNLPANARDARDMGSVLGLERGGNGNPLQYSCLENPMEEKPGELRVTRVRHN